MKEIPYYKKNVICFFLEKNLQMPEIQYLVISQITKMMEATSKQIEKTEAGKISLLP